MILRVLLGTIGVTIGLAVAEFIFASARSAHRTLNPDQYITKREAHIEGRSPMWIMKPVRGNQLELAGHFFNSGEMSTIAVVTNQVLIKGQDVTEPLERGPDHVNFPAPPVPADAWAGPIFYLRGAAYKAAMEHPETLEVRTTFVYPNGLGSVMQLDQHLSFHPGLRISVENNATRLLK
jgi:hypothetical protein